jgi:hypothetical protein
VAEPGLELLQFDQGVIQLVVGQANGVDLLQCSDLGPQAVQHAHTRTLAQSACSNFHNYEQMYVK